MLNAYEPKETTYFMISLIKNVFHRQIYRDRKKMLGSQSFGPGKEMESGLIKDAWFLNVLINMIQTVLMVAQPCD